MYKLKSIARRSTALGAAFAVLATAVIPAAPAFADALNPLTDRSLTLSSGAPGWDDMDGSGNTTYAPPNSGANGRKTGNTFAFKVSTNTTGTGTNDPIKDITFQYCTKPAGDCLAPGNNGWAGAAPAATRNDNGSTQDALFHSDLEVIAASPTQIEQAALSTYVDTAAGLVTSIPAANSTGTNFIVMYKSGGTWVSSDDWGMTVEEAQFGVEGDEESTGTDNQIRLTHTGLGQGLLAGTEVKVVFFGTDTNYITNPGADEFFVRINTYEDGGSVIDGGVTVANVMNQGIQITTKVLETMDFSVGTVDPYTLDSTDTDGGTAGVQSQLKSANGNDSHGTCDPVLGAMTSATGVTERNRLLLGDELGEFSLETDTTYSTHSYWRLSSNSSAGATVYYSGVTLSNTVGDKIDAIYGSNPGDGEAGEPTPGMEQFGIAFDNGTSATVDLDISNPPDAVNDVAGYHVNYGVERTGADIFENADDNTTSGIHASVATDVGSNPSYHAPRLYPLVPGAEYDGGTGVINDEYGTVNTSFAFDETSSAIPVPMATESSQVVDCVTGKVNYIANIAATTPAGIYTTKVNYIASPQY